MNTNIENRNSYNHRVNQQLDFFRMLDDVDIRPSANANNSQSKMHAQQNQALSTSNYAY